MSIQNIRVEDGTFDVVVAVVASVTSAVAASEDIED